MRSWNKKPYNKCNLNIARKSINIMYFVIVQSGHCNISLYFCSDIYCNFTLASLIYHVYVYINLLQRIA